MQLLPAKKQTGWRSWLQPCEVQRKYKVEAAVSSEALLVHSTVPLALLVPLSITIAKQPAEAVPRMMALVRDFIHPGVCVSSGSNMNTGFVLDMLPIMSSTNSSILSPLAI